MEREVEEKEIRVTYTHSFLFQAKQVLQWRVDKPDEAYKIWEALADVNEEIQSSLEELWHLAEVAKSHCVVHLFWALCVHHLNPSMLALQCV